MYDADGSLLALASFWCAVNNRFIGTEQWSQENFVGNVVHFFEQTTICFPESVLRDRLDRPVPSYSVDILLRMISLLMLRLRLLVKQNMNPGY